MRYLILLTALVLFGTGCRSIDKLFEEGQYEKAFKLSLKQLSEDPDDKVARDYLERSLVQILVAEETEVVQLWESNEATKWEKALTKVYDINDRLDQARPYIEIWTFDEDEVWLEEQEASLRQGLYTAFYEDGMSQLTSARNSGDAATGRQAHIFLKKAIRYRPTDLEVEDSLTHYSAEALELGKVYYQVEINKGFNTGLSWEIDRAFDRLDGQIGEYVYVKETFIANGGDCSIEINIGELDIQYSERSDRRDFSREVIIGYDTTTDSEGNTVEVPKYSEVNGSVDIVTSTKRAIWSVDVDIDRNTRNCPLSDNSYRDAVESVIETYRLNGDQRAIPDEYRSGTNEEHTDDDDMAEEILDRLARRIRDDYFADLQ